MMNNLATSLAKPIIRPKDEAEVYRNLAQNVEAFDSRLKQSEEILASTIRKIENAEKGNARVRAVIRISSAISSASTSIILTTALTTPLAVGLGAIVGSSVLTYWLVDKYLMRK